MPLVLLVAGLPVPSRRLAVRLLAAGRPGDRCCGEAPRIEATYLFASKSRQAERLRQTEQKRLQALVDADVAVAGALIASDFELINPLGEVLTREAILGGVGAGAVDCLSNTVTSLIKVRLHGSTAVLRYQHTIDVAVAGIGHLTHSAWTTALYERRKGNWQIVWAQTGAIGPLPLPS